MGNRMLLGRRNLLLFQGLGFRVNPGCLGRARGLCSSESFMDGFRTRKARKGLS